MKRRKIQIGLLVLILLMCCGLNPTAWAADYIWNGNVWLRGSTETNLANATSLDRLVIQGDNANLTTAGLKQSAHPAIYFSPNLAETLTLDVAEGVTDLGDVSGVAGGHYILRAYAPTLNLGNVSIDGGWLRLKHATGGLGSGTVTADMLWADNTGIIYVDTMSAIIGNAALADAADVPVVIAGNGGNITFTIGNYNNKMTVNGSVITGSNTAAAGGDVPVHNAAYWAARFQDSAKFLFPVASNGDNAWTDTLAASGKALTTAQLATAGLTAGSQWSAAQLTLGTVAALGAGDKDTTLLAADFAAGIRWFAWQYTGTWTDTVSRSFTTPGSVNVIGTGTAAQSPTSAASFVVTGSIYLNRYVKDTLKTNYTMSGNGYIALSSSNAIAFTAVGRTGDATINNPTSIGSLWSGTTTRTIGVSDATTAALYAFNFGSFACTDAALYIGGALSGGVNAPWSATVEGLPPAGGTNGSLDLRGTEAHFGAVGPAATDITDVPTMSTFSALAPESVLTDENTSFTFYPGTDPDTWLEITDFPQTPAAGRTLGSLYFKGSVILDTTDSATDPVAAGRATSFLNKNITLAGNFEMAHDTVLNLIALGTGTLTINGYVDLGDGEEAKLLVSKGANLVFNGAIRGWSSGVFSQTATDAGISAFTDVSDVLTSDATDFTTTLYDALLFANLTIGVNGQEHGDSVAALPASFTAIGNFTLNRANTVLTMLDSLTIVGDLNINAGTIKVGLKADTVTPTPLRVLGNTTIGRNGVLNLNLPAAATADPATKPVLAAIHRLGTHSIVPGNLTVNGLLTFEGYNPTDTLMINGPIQPSQGTFQGNAHSVLILYGLQSYSLPATLTELLQLTYKIDNAATMEAQSNVLTLQSDLEVGKLENGGGILRLAGYKLSVKDVSTIGATADLLGRIDATSGSELVLAAVTTGIAEGAYPALQIDETTDLTIKNLAWLLPTVAAPAPATEFKVNNLNIISDLATSTAMAGAASVHPFGAKVGAGLILGVQRDDSTASDPAADSNDINVEIMGNLNVINNVPATATIAGITGAIGNGGMVKSIIVHGDVAVTNNNTAATAAAPGAWLRLDSTSLSLYGQLALGGKDAATAALAAFATDTATTLSILGESKRFEFPAKTNSYSMAKLTLNRPAGARFNNTENVYNATTNIYTNAFTHFFGNPKGTLATQSAVVDIQRGDLNLNGNNITFANPFDFLQETAGNTVINTGTSHFDVLVQDLTNNATPATTTRVAPTAGTKPPFTRGAILSHYVATAAGVGITAGLIDAKQLKGIGLENVLIDNNIADAVVATDLTANYYAAASLYFQSNARRYPKGVFVPDVGISAQRYYYIKPQADGAKQITAYYDMGEIVGTENTMKFYLESVDNVKVSSDAFSNAEQLQGTTQISPATVATSGKIDGQKFLAGKSYNVHGPESFLDSTKLGYLLAVAALPGGGGYKEWTGAVDSLWQVAGNWGPTPGAPGPLDQAIINRSNDTIVITGIATCSDLLINGDDILIKGQRGTTGTNAILRTTGNIYNYGLSSIKGVDGNNRLDLQVNNPDAPIATGVMTTITSATEPDATGSTGVWFDNVTVTTATLLPSDGMRISGNISLSGNSTMQQDPGQRVVLYGPNTTAKTLSAPTGNAAVFGDIVLTNQAYMTTTSSLMLRGMFDFEDAASIWESTDGTITATYAAADLSDTAGSATPYTINAKGVPQKVWNNPSNARFVVNNIQIGANLPKDTSETIGTDTYNTIYDWGTNFAQPVGTITVAGRFDKIGSSTLEPLKTPYVSGGNGNYAVVFSSNRQTEISNGAGSVLRIPNLIVTPNTKLRTNSSFNISNHLEVQTNAEMLCNSGSVTFDGKDIMTIINVSDRTLVMNNINVEGRVTTPSSWKLAGNLNINPETTTATGGTGTIGTVLTESYFDQTAGTITIQNGGQNRRLIDNMATGTAPKPNITFNKLYIDSVSRLTTGPQTGADTLNANFAIKNRVANGTMATGIELAAGSGLFFQPVTGTVYFQTDGAVLDTTAKWIINGSTAEKMQFGNIFIAPENTGNTVRTKSSFEVIGTGQAGLYDAEFLVAGGGANFEALEGTITFPGTADATDTDALIASLAPSKAQFANLRANNGTILNVDGQTEIFVSENLIVDGTASIAAGTAALPARVELNGKTRPQYLTGTSTATTPFTFTRLLINKGATPGSSYAAAPYSDSTGVVVLQKNVTIIEGTAGHQSELILANGVLNLSNNNLSNGAEYITYQPGYSAIDGAAGKYTIIAGHQTKKLEDPMFTVAGSPTLYDIDVQVDHQLANSLTVNNDLTLTSGILSLAPAGVAEVVEPKTLTLYGDLIPGAGLLASGSLQPTVYPVGANAYKDNTLTRLILKGTGIVQGGLKNELFDGNEVFSITVARGETLGGNLTMDTTNGANLTIQTGVNTLNLGTNTLILSDKTPTANSNGVTVVSGSLTAATASVDFRNLTVVPANIFARSEVGSINFGAATNGGTPGAFHPAKVEIRGNVRVLTALTISPDAAHPAAADDYLRIYTGNNKLTLLTPSDALDETHYIVGNLVMPISNLNAAVFHVGNPETYTPVTMQLGPGSSAAVTPEVLATAINVDPTAGRGGNASNSINQTWTIEPQADFTDSLLLEFSFPGQTNETLGITDMPNQFLTGNTFAAKWEEGRWRDYRTVINVLAAGAQNTVSGALGRYAVVGSAALAGPWAVFAANANTDAAKNDAIAINKNKLVVTELATPITTGIAFQMTIALQDQYNQPITTTADLPVVIQFTNGGLTFAEPDVDGGGREAIIPAGQSTVEVTLQADNATTTYNTHSPVAQIQVSATGTEAANWTPAITDYFPVIPGAPNSQAYDLTFTRATYTDVKVTWTNGDGENVIIVAKANGSLVIPDEVPRNGFTYVPNMVYGAGSNIGDAVVLYNGPALGSELKQSIDVAGLIPSTTYTLYAFAYNGTRGEESYNISSAQRNPNSFATGTGDDDDIAFGGRPHSNDSIIVSATVGTNAPITGNVVDASDYDCFNFTVTDEAPNVRVLLTNVPGDYTLELYDFTGRRIRRSTLLEDSNEALVVNNLPAGTFVVRVFPTDANAPLGEYKLLINTFSSEIFSVTPAPNME